MHNNTIIFRFVVNNDSGLGHFFRCLNTAKKLIANYNIIFIIDNKSDISLVKKNKLLPYSIIQLPELNSISEEHSYLKKIIKGYNVKWFVTDICTNNLLHTDRDYLNRYHTSLKNSFDIKIISFEDFRINLFSSDCAVVWNAKDNHQKNHRGHKTLYGLKYFICSPEMTKLSKVERTINKNGKRLLIFISGSCNNNPTETLVEYFKEKIPNGIYVRIICSKRNYGENWGHIRELCESKEMYFELFDINDQIYDHLMWADLAIVGEGLIKYEAAILGTPAIQIFKTQCSSTYI